MTESIALPPDPREQHHAGIPLIGPDGHFVDSVSLECADDTEATEQAKQLVDGHDVELWQRDRKIAAFDGRPKTLVLKNEPLRRFSSSYYALFAHDRKQRP